MRSRLDERTACCLDPARRPACGTEFSALRAWVCRTTGKGVALVKLTGSHRGKAPFFAQPVGFDGRSFLLNVDHGCDTEKLLHEACHFLVAPKHRRNRMNYGLGPGPADVSTAEADNEELTVMFLERLLAPIFKLPESRIARPDYNVADRRLLDWEACEQRAQGFFEALQPSLRPQAPAPASSAGRAPG